MIIPELNTLTISLNGHIADIRLNRPEKSNAINEAMWREIRQAFEWADCSPEVRVVILSGEGRHFSSGIDLAMLQGIHLRIAGPDGARSRETLRRIILDLQNCLTSIEQCRKPVLAAIHGACVGGALDLVTCCDMRYVATDAVFSIKEIDIGMVADVGTLQRLPRLIGEGMTRELAYTGRTLDAMEAVARGLANRSFSTRESLLAGVMDTAQSIAQKSPLAIRGSKEILNFSRDHTVADGLNFVATWNAAMLLSTDLQESFSAQQDRRPPRYDA